MELGLPCVHCGLCLDKCPTYRDSGEEAESPRGRIYMMEAVKNGALTLDADVAAHLDSCLGCLACEPACPSGVEFHRRIEEFRPGLPLAALTRAWRRTIAAAMRRPYLTSAALAAASTLDAVGLRRLRRRLPGLGLLPGRSATVLQRDRVQEPATPRLKVALLAGCSADTVMPEINRAAVEVLHRNGVAVRMIGGGACCGALPLHEGDTGTFQRLARTLTARPELEDVDYVVSTAAGCSATLGEYEHLIGGDGAAVAAKTRDICELLVEIGFDTPIPAASSEGTVAYHDACHLLNVRGVAEAPRAVIRAATGATPVDVGENDICCGSAGSYNLRHPRIATRLARRKAELVARSGASTLAAGNAGCLLQIARACDMAGIEMRCRHPVELLAEAYRRG